jgi:hypothetical protein
MRKLRIFVLAAVITAFAGSSARAQIIDVNDVGSPKYYQPIIDAIDGDLKYNPDQCLTDAQRAEMLARIGAAIGKLYDQSRELSAAKASLLKDDYAAAKFAIARGLGKLWALEERVKKYPRCPPPSLPPTPPHGPRPLPPSMWLTSSPFQFNFGVEGGGASLHTSFEETQLKVDGGLAGATFGARWNGMNNGFAGVQGTLLFPFVTASGGEGASFSSATTSKLQTLVTFDALVGERRTIDVFDPLLRGYIGSIEYYGFIGVATGSVKVTQSDLSLTQTLVGPTAGVGAALNVAPNVQVFTEARYFNLLDRSFQLAPTGPPTEVGQSGFVFTGGVKVQFGHNVVEFGHTP